MTDTNPKIEFCKKLLTLIEEGEKLDIGQLTDIKQKVIGSLQYEELCEMFGVRISQSAGYGLEEWFRDSAEGCFGLYGSKYNRTISWSDDDRQPEDEWLYCLSFSGGAYIFGNYFEDDYPVGLFKQFFDELKAFNPKYSDTHNHSLYFDPTTTKSVYEAYNGIYKKYKDQSKAYNAEQKIKKLQDEVAKLQESLK